MCEALLVTARLAFDLFEFLNVFIFLSPFHFLIEKEGNGAKAGLLMN